MALSAKALLVAATGAVPKISPHEAKKKLNSGALLVDVREPAELRETGKIRGAINVTRENLESLADPESPDHDPAFRKDRPVILYCASGGRSALAGKMLKDLGYESVFNAGGFSDLADGGLEHEPA